MGFQTPALYILFCVGAARWKEIRKTGKRLRFASIGRKPTMRLAHFLARPLCTITLCCFLIAGAAIRSAAVAAPVLGTYNVEPTQITISGFSAGGFFAMQMGIAYSSVFAGVGIFAGGPYDCARHALVFGCVNNAVPEIGESIANMKSWSGNRIDNVLNIGRQRIYIFSGKQDYTVGPNVTRQVKRLYVDVGGFDSAENVKYVELAGASHTFPTAFDGAGDSPCDLTLLPYISDCGFDGAGDALRWFYGTLRPPNTGTLRGTLLAFDQTPFAGRDAGMDSTGWVYVPADCAAGRRCGLHVALHGCQQAYAIAGAYFLNNTGYNRWADTNELIVLYPQTSASLTNPFGCWDWFGLYGMDFDQKSGTQMKALMAMIRQIAGGRSVMGRARNAHSPERNPSSARTDAAQSPALWGRPRRSGEAWAREGS